MSWLQFESVVGHDSGARDFLNACHCRFMIMTSYDQYHEATDDYISSVRARSLRSEISVISIKSWGQTKLNIAR